MPKAPGCLVGGREMRGRSGSHNAEGIGASAESGRGDDRGLTHGPDIAAENRMVPMGVHASGNEVEKGRGAYEARGANAQARD